MIKDGKINLSVPLEEIIYIQAEHVYIRLYLRSQQSVLYRNSLSKVWAELQNDHFLRIHRSYVVNLRAVTYFTATYVMIGEEKLNIGRAYQEAAADVLSRWETS